MACHTNYGFKKLIFEKNVYLYYGLGTLSFILLYIIIDKYILLKNKKREVNNV